VQPQFVDQTGGEMLVDGARAAMNRDVASPAASRAWASADSTPSVTKWYVVPPSIGYWSRVVGEHEGRGVERQIVTPPPFHCRSHSPRTGPNMFRPMM
jgi:hypothetical protein